MYSENVYMLQLLHVSLGALVKTKMADVCPGHLYNSQQLQMYLKLVQVCKC